MERMLQACRPRLEKAEDWWVIHYDSVSIFLELIKIISTQYIQIA
jgi:hypothetical protein